MFLKVFRPNLIDYINLSKVLDNYRRCKCTSGESRVGLVCMGGTSVLSLKKILVSLFFSLSLGDGPI